MSFSSFNQPAGGPATGVPMFTQPSSGGDFFTAKDHEGALLLIKPLSFEQGISTQMGPSDAVKANVIILDGPNKDQEFNDTLIFPKVLVSQVKANLTNNQWVLGRLGKGQAKPGQSAPWQLQEFSQQDAELAQAWLNAHPQSDNPWSSN